MGVVLFPLRARTSAVSPLVPPENRKVIVVPDAVVLEVNHQTQRLHCPVSAQLLPAWKLFCVIRVAVWPPAIVSVGVLLPEAKAVMTYVVPDVMLNVLVDKFLEPLVPDATLVTARLTRFVSEKFTVPATPVALPTTLYVPVVALAVIVDDVACPLAPVVATHEYVWGFEVQPAAAKVSDAPDAGPAKVTETPWTPLP
jgi:hypothetical protein